MAVIQLSDRELTRLRTLIDLIDGRLTGEAAGTLMGLCRVSVDHGSGEVRFDQSD
jgi:hypothetical protein